MTKETDPAPVGLRDSNHQRWSIGKTERAALAGYINAWARMLKKKPILV
jgi:hypothetical protein